MILRYFFAFLLGYLFGNVSFSSIIAKVFADKDIRKIGSGNPGATNVLRTMGLKYAVFVFILDALKAVIPAIVGCFIIGKGANEFSLLSGFYCPEIFAGGLGAVLGHNFPVFAHFKGGKGVSCTLGLLTVANPLLGLGLIALSGILNLKIKIYSIVSVSVMLLASLLYTFVDVLPEMQWIQICVVWGLFALMLFMHRENLFRLARGTEKKIKIFKSEDEQ